MYLLQDYMFRNKLCDVHRPWGRNTIPQPVEVVKGGSRVRNAETLNPKDMYRSPLAAILWLLKFLQPRSGSQNIKKRFLRKTHEDEFVLVG